MNTEYQYLRKPVSLRKLASEIDAGGKITFKKADKGVVKCCPACKKPVIRHSNQKWNSSWICEEVPEDTDVVFGDGDAISSACLEDSFAEMFFGRCPHCEEKFTQIELFCFANVPKPAHSNHDSKGIFIYDSSRMVISMESNELLLVCVNDVPVGVVSYGKNIVFDRRGFHGCVVEDIEGDFVSDCCVFLLDCLGVNAALDNSPIGVCNGHFGSDEGARSEWKAAEIVGRALYLSGKKYMKEQRF